MLAIEPVQYETACKTRDGGGETVGRNEMTKLRRPDFEDPHQLRSQRDHDHEIEYVREMHRHEREQDNALSGGQLFMRRGRHKGSRALTAHRNSQLRRPLTAESLGLKGFQS
jgi:hypothetical protein